MDIQRLIELNIEIEGALRVYGERGSEDALAIARTKAQQLNELLSEPAEAEHVTEDVTEDETEDEAAYDQQPTVTFAVNSQQEPEEELVDDELSPKVTDPITVSPASSVTQNPASTPASISEHTVAPTYTPKPAADSQSTMPLRRIPIRNYFTINDKYLFRREVFDGDEQAFEDTLDLFEAMHSFAEAEEYFYDDLMLDRDNENVKAFMSIVQNYFKR